VKSGAGESRERRRPARKHVRASESRNASRNIIPVLILTAAGVEVTSEILR